jgi:hypothetical protein
MHVLRTIALFAAVVVNRAAVEALRVTRLAPAGSASAVVRQATFVEPPPPRKLLDVRATLAVIARGFLVIGPVPSLSSVFGLLDVFPADPKRCYVPFEIFFNDALCAERETGESGNLLINRLDQLVGYVDGLSRGARQNHLNVLEGLLRLVTDPIPYGDHIARRQQLAFAVVAVVAAAAPGREHEGEERSCASERPSRSSSHDRTPLPFWRSSLTGVDRRRKPGTVSPTHARTGGATCDSPTLVWSPLAKLDSARPTPLGSLLSTGQQKATGGDALACPVRSLRTK